MEQLTEIPVALVVLTRDQFRDLIEDAIAHALDQYVKWKGPEKVDSVFV